MYHRIRDTLLALKDDCLADQRLAKLTEKPLDRGAQSHAQSRIINKALSDKPEEFAAVHVSAMAA